MRPANISSSSLRLSLAVSIASVVVVAFTMSGVGCSSSDPTAVFTPPAADGASPPVDTVTEAGSFFPEGGSADSASPADAAAMCTSVALPAFMPTWKPPVASGSACMKAQITGYFAACLQAPINAQTCTTFMAANKTCSDCLESDESAAQYGPIIWHEKHSFYTFNIAGCIAAEQKDVTTTGCGAAYQAAVTCQQASCQGCFAGAGVAFDVFKACEKTAAAGACASFGTTEGTKCGNLDVPDASAFPCFPTSNTESNEDYLSTFAPIFCGGQ